MSTQDMQTAGVPEAQGITLLEGEEVRHNLKPSWAAFFGTINVILTLISVGMWLIVWVPVVWWVRSNNRYIVTTERVIRKAGIISTSTEEYRIEDIRQLQTGQSYTEKIFGVGNLQFSTAAGGSVITFGGLDNHQGVANTIREFQRS